MSIFSRAVAVGFMSCVAAFAHAQPVSVQVLSAVVKDQTVSGAEVLLQKNGAQSVVGTTDAEGRVTLSAAFADDADSTLIVRKDGFSTLVAKCPCTGMTYAISPVMADLDGMRVVLSWGKIPADLDSHLIFPDNHISFTDPKGDGAHLDVDDVDGMGPETITLQKRQNGKRYVYAVHDFANSGRPQSTALSQGQAKVFVYVGQSLVRTYYVPEQKPGNLWVVFRINENGDLQDINEMLESSDVSAGLAPYMKSAEVTQQDTSAGNSSSARAMNQQGEVAYRAGKLEAAIELYVQAIGLDSNNGQIYSNLGLAYQKAGRTAEAIWANRKAIALADGANAASVKASSFYNIGRIYEAANQFADALRHYQLAKEQKGNPVYDKAILRVQKSL